MFLVALLALPASYMLIPGAVTPVVAEPSAVPLADAWVTNGTVRSIVSTGDVTYLGGDFTRIGPATGSCVPIDTSTGETAAAYPKVDGVVKAVASDGSGGWYIGGKFTTVGGASRANIAHVLAAGTVDPDWHPGTDDYVLSLAVSGSMVYAGGLFTGMTGTSGGSYVRNRLAAIDVSTGDPTSWDPNASGSISALAVAGPIVYAGGAFITLQGSSGGPYSRYYLAAIDASTGNPTAWDPHPNQDVSSLVLNGSNIYAGGAFTSVQGSSGGPYARNRLAAIDLSTGNPTAWNPGANSTVLDLAISGSSVYAGGLFTTIGGLGRNYIGAIDLDTGAVTAANPGADDFVRSLTASGSTVYAGGEFTSLGGVGHDYIAAIDASTGNPTSWDPGVGDYVYAIAVSGSTVCAGGEFTTVGGTRRNHLAAMDTDPTSPTRGLPTAWDPDLDKPVWSLALSGSTLYVGGQFNIIQGSSGGPYYRNCIAALDTAAGNPTAWNPDVNYCVYSLAISGGLIYAGGSFSYIQGASGGPYARTRLAAIDLETGNPTGWSPGVYGGINTVNDLAVSGSTVYAGGRFDTVKGTSGNSYERTNLAAIDASSGEPTGWSTCTNGTVHTLAISGSTVYAGGEFSMVQGVSGSSYARNKIAAIDASSGEATAWSPYLDGKVNDIAVSGPTVYAGGGFTSVYGTSGNPYDNKYLAAIDSSSGDPTTWNPDLNGAVMAVAVSPYAVHAGGVFDMAGGAPHSDYAIFKEAVAVTSITPGSGAGGSTLSVTDLAGDGFEAGAQVTLRKDGQGDIAATNEVAVSTNRITCDLDLAGARPGAWDVVVTNPGGAAGVLAGGFSITGDCAITSGAGPHGSIDPAGAVTVAYGSDKSFAITPDTGYHVDDVLIDGASVGAVETYTFTGVVTDHTIQASFTNELVISASAGPHGSIDPTGPVAVAYGADQSFTITPDVNYHVVDVVVDGVSQGPLDSYTFTGVTDDHIISASFASDTNIIELNNDPVEEAWVADQEVRCMVPAGDVTYIGGDFHSVGPNTGHGVVLDAASGLTTVYPKVNGMVHASVCDGSGGWYIGGFFTRVSGVDRVGLAHILADGSVDPDWEPRTNGTGIVYALALSGNTLYAGGTFTSLFGTSGDPYTRRYLAAIDAASGDPTAWAPNPDFFVWDIAVSGDSVFVGGEFTGIQGASGGPYNRGYLAEIDAATGNPTPWDPSADSYVFTLALSGDTLYAGGEFTYIQGASGGPYYRGYMAAIDTDTGNPTAWKANADSPVSDIAVSGTTVYMGGDFTEIQTGMSFPQRRLYIAAVDGVTNALLSWSPDQDLPVEALCVTGSTVYIAARRLISAVDASQESPAIWSTITSQSTLTLASNGSGVYAGGEFDTVGGVLRNHVAAIDTDRSSPTYGQPTDWAPNVQSGTVVRPMVLSMALYGNTLYVGGKFDSVNLLPRNGLAAIDATTGETTAWDPDVDYDVSSIAADSSTVYAGGDIHTVGGLARNNLAAIDAVTGEPTDWNPDVNGEVYALVLDGSTLYAGGTFSSIQGSSGGPYARDNLAAIDTATANPTAWDPGADGTVWCIETAGTTLYAGGMFMGMGDESRNYIAAIDNDPVSPTYGQPTDWAPVLDDGVGGITVIGSTIFAGGLFHAAGDDVEGLIPRNHLVGLDGVTGNPTAWNPDADSEVYCLGSSDGPTLYAGGWFTKMGGETCYGFAIFDDSPTVTSITPDTGVNTGPVSVTDLAGTGFKDIETVALRRSGESDIIAGNVVVVSPEKITCDFDLTGAETGKWEVVVTRTTGLKGTLPAGFTVTGDCVIDASAGAGGSIDPSGEVVVAYGADQAFTITPDEGRHVADVLVDGFSQGPVTGYTFNHVTSNHTIEASFALDTFVIDASAGLGGSITPDGTVDVAYGDDQAFTINPDEGYHLTDVVVDGSPQGPLTSYTFYDVTGYHTIEASFALDEHTVTASVNGGHGSISPATQQVSYAQDATVYITPDPGYMISYLTDNGEPQLFTSTYTVQCVIEDRQVVVEFERSIFTVNALVTEGNGTVSPASQQVSYAQSATIAITPDPGYRIESILDNDTAMPVSGTYVIEEVWEDHTVEVGFAADESPGATWYLAEGCTDGHMETWVLVQNPQASEVTVDLILQTSTGEQRPAGLQGQVIPAAARRSFNLGAYVTDYDVSTKVAATGGEVVCERSMYGNGNSWGHDSIGTNAPDTVWYLAEGCTDGHMETWVLVQNPGTEEVTVDLTLMTGKGELKPEGLQGATIPANTRRSFRLNDYVTDYQVSTRITSSGGVVCERSMYGPGKTWGTNSIGVTAPSATWYLAEGCTEDHMDTWVLVQNPGTAEVTVDLTLQTSSGELKPEGLQGVPVPAGARRTFYLNDYVTDYDVSTLVEASGGVVCERAMYGNGNSWGHDSIGVTAPAEAWFLAEGCTEGQMETWVLVQNPGTEEVVVILALMSEGGAEVPPGLQGVTIPAGTRRGFRLNDYVTEYDVSTLVAASGGVVCERAVYGPGRTWGTDSIGYPAP